MEEISFDRETYKKNIELLKEKNSFLGHSVEFFEPSGKIKFCRTQQGELNLSQTRYGLTEYFHSQEGAYKEAEKIASEEIAKITQVIYFYGLGLGYIYDGLKDWLKIDPERHLILLEDDLEILNCFLHTEKATNLLQDPQVILHRHYESNLEVNFLYLLYPFISLKSQFLTLPYYILRKESLAQKLCYDIYYFQLLLQQLSSEFLSGQQGFLKNFYRNLLYLDQSYQSSGLYGKFKNIPAIICGAGPSLEKNIEDLKQLTERALIFAGGSSLNAINSYGIIPHFGLGIDPNPEQLHRLLTSHAFYIPFFYRNRLTHEAFQLIQGEKIYASGSPNPLPNWFEERYGISAPNLEEGHNVVNFCTDIARLLGCNPIIFVGLDLSYSENKTYAPGINTHPLWLGQSYPYRPEQEQLIHRKGIDGGPIITKWPWVAESIWVQHFASVHKEIEVINATEGGLGFVGVPNKTLKEVAHQYLTKTYDLFNRVQGEIQNSKIKMTRGDIFKGINEMLVSLEKAVGYCKNIVEEQRNHINKKSDQLYSPKSILNEVSLHEEISYKHFLHTIDQAHHFLGTSVRLHTKQTIEPESFLINHYLFLVTVLGQHIDLLKSSVQRFMFSTSHYQTGPKSSPEIQGTYQIRGGILQIEDKDVELKVEKKFEPRIEKEFYPNGELKISLSYNQDKLEGPSQFFSDKGIVLAESWFVDGLREGKGYSYYETGSVRFVHRYRHNRLHGNQEYYFPNGALQMVLPFKEGLLEGCLKVYFPSGKQYREIYYLGGKRHGTETQWNHLEKCIAVCEYQHGVPVGVAKAWNNGGDLIKEVTIHRYPDDFDVKIWDETGKEIQTINHGLEDFSQLYTEKQKQVDILHNTVNAMVEQLDAIMEKKENYLSTVTDPELNEQLRLIKKTSQNINEMKDQLTKMKDEYFKQVEEQTHLRKENSTHEKKE